MPRATWFCVDIECSGPVPSLYDMLSVGVVPVTPSPGGGFTTAPALYVEIQPTAPRVDPGAMKVCGLDLDHLRRNGLSLEDALDRISAFVAEHTLPGSKPVFVGHNAPFDWSFVCYSYHATGRVNPFGYKALDTKALATGALRVHWFDSSKEELERRLNLPPQDPARTHRADYDAEYQALILIRLLEELGTES
jgi:ribonuclease T